MMVFQGSSSENCGSRRERVKRGKQSEGVETSKPNKFHALEHYGILAFENYSGIST